MIIVDERGRLFGRVNLVDAAAAAFLLGLVPMAYGTYLLFRPTTPRIDSVTRVEISREERRLATGGLLTAKVKVRGTGFNPMLRAFIGSSQSLGFVFENPNSADVLVGAVPPGTHDLALFDGLQEVARARGVITITEPERTAIRAVGWFTNLDAGTAATLVPGFAAPQPTPTFTVVAVAPARPGRARVLMGGAVADLPVAGQVEREAVVTISCDPSPDPTTCSVSGRAIADPAPVVVSAGGWRFEIADVLPVAPPRRARVQVRWSSAAALVKTGDRDRFLDERAAIVAAANGATAAIALGVDEARDGWRYRGQALTPGVAFTLRTDRYVATGEVVSIEVQP